MLQQALPRPCGICLGFRATPEDIRSNDGLMQRSALGCVMGWNCPWNVHGRIKMQPVCMREHHRGPNPVDLHGAAVIGLGMHSEIEHHTPREQKKNASGRETTNRTLWSAGFERWLAVIRHWQRQCRNVHET